MELDCLLKAKHFDSAPDEVVWKQINIALQHAESKENKLIMVLGK